MPDTPTSYPTWRFWADGRTAIVQTPAELAALLPGHAGSPAGPFPAPEQSPEAVEAAEPLEDPAEEPLASLREQARALHAQGATVTEIARTVQRSPRTVGRWLGD